MAIKRDEEEGYRRTGRWAKQKDRRKVDNIMTMWRRTKEEEKEEEDK